MRDEYPEYYEDTISLFDYGFSNFEKVNISETETKYNISNAGAFYSDIDIFGSSRPILTINKDDYVILPKTALFSETDSSISYDTGSDLSVALITYTWHGAYLGSASLDLAVNTGASYSFDTSLPTAENMPETKESNFVFINVFKILLYVLAGFLALTLILFLLYSLITRHLSPGSNRLMWKVERFKRRLPFGKSSRGERRSQKRAARRRRRSERRRARKRSRDDLYF